MFRINFPYGFFYEDVQRKWGPVVKRMKLPYETVEDFMNAQIQSVDFPGVSFDNAEQQQRQYPVVYPTGKELEAVLDKNLTIRFKLTESYLTYWILFDQLDYYLKYSRDNHKQCFMQPLRLTFLNTGGFGMLTFEFKQLVPTSLGNLPLSYAAQAADFKTVDFGLKYSRYDIISHVNE